jgi:hypothetical protein
MRWALLLFLVLSSCSEPESVKLKRQYDLLEKNNASKEELCDKSREIVDALVREESEDYLQKKLEVSHPCIELQVDRLKLVQ